MVRMHVKKKDVIRKSNNAQEERNEKKKMLVESFNLENLGLYLYMYIVHLGAHVTFSNCLSVFM